MTERRNQVRIIGGKWRGRKLSFPSLADLRPTSDRARETLFNWLAADLAGARVLDLFAGSGALGFEALSRGAAALTAVDVRSRVVEQLRTQWQSLSTESEENTSVSIVRADARGFLDRALDQPPFDGAFVDPPFDSDLLADVVTTLVARMAPSAWIYIEQPSRRDPPRWPEGWLIDRETRVGEVTLRLLRRTR